MLDLLPLLEDLGIQGLRVGAKEISGFCPAHEARTGRANTNTQAWSINRETGAHICYSCGFKGGLADVYRAVGEAVPEDLESELAKQSIEASLARATREETVYTQTSPMIMDLPWLRSFPPMPENMLAHRFIRPEAAQMYDLHWDFDGKRWVIPIMSPHGELMGVQYRATGQRPDNFPKELVKSTTLFGLHLIPPTVKIVVVVESPLDVVRLWCAGVWAVASFGVYISDAQLDLLSRNFTMVVVAVDNPAIDKAGREALEPIMARLRRRGCPAIVFDYTGLVDRDGNVAKDPGDVADDYSLYQAFRHSLGIRGNP